MQTPLAVVEGAYLKDILEQPQAMRRTAAALAASNDDAAAIHTLISTHAIQRIVLTGMGSSYHSLHPLFLKLSRAGHFVQMLEASEAFHYLPEIFGSQTLTIAVSQSGESAEIVRLLSAGFLDGPVVGITNTAASTLAAKSTIAIQTHAGPESTVSCKTYLAGLQALHWLGAALLGEDLNTANQQLEQIATDVATYLKEWTNHVDSLLELLGGIEQFYITGRGPSMATAGTGGLILKESTRSSAEGMSSAAFRHGPLEVLSRRVLTCVCQGDDRTSDLNLRLYNQAARTDASAFLIGHLSQHKPFQIPKVLADLLPILEILPIQMLSLALAARHGFEAGKFSLASKITGTE